MLQLAAEGLGEIVARPEPLGLAGHEAIAAWNFCGGWQPQHLPLFAALHGLPDAELTLHLMQVIRDQEP